MTTPEKDIREGLPSASGTERFVNCAGSHQAEQGMPPLPEQAVTRSGTEIHDALESGDDSALEEDDATVAKRLSGMEHKATDDWMRDRGFDYIGTAHREERLWIRDRKTLDLIASAQLDVFYIQGTEALFIDFKSGFKKTTASEKNWQVLTQALALWHEYPQLTNFRGGIAASRLTSTLDLVEYSAEQLAFAERELQLAVWKSKQPNPPRTPGSWCQYCRANGHCTEAAAYSSIVLFNGDLKDWSKLSIIEAVAKMEPAQMAHVFVRSKIANIIFENVEARLKNMPAAELEKIGLNLKPGAEKRSLTDVPKAWETIASLLTEPERLACISIAIGKLTKAIAKKKNLKEADAKILLEQTLSGLIVKTQNKPSLEIV